MRHISKGNPNRGPGDFNPPEPEELADRFIEQALEQLAKQADQGDIDVEDITDDAVTERAWELQREAKKQAEYDAGEDAYYDAEDRARGLD